jgi:hypothetical protein
LRLCVFAPLRSIGWVGVLRESLGVFVPSWLRRWRVGGLCALSASVFHWIPRTDWHGRPGGGHAAVSPPAHCPGRCALILKL